jgi:hypothetical protein
MAGLCVGAVPAGAWAQSVTETELRAAFEFSFVKFTEWPADVVRPGSAVTLCVVDSKPLATALQRVVAGHAVAGHELRVVLLKPGESARACQIVDVGGLDAKGQAQLLFDLKSTAVLTVGDAPHFAERGGVAQLFVEDNRMRFGINVSAAQRARLQLSSKLLSLAKLIEDE